MPTDVDLSKVICQHTKCSHPATSHEHHAPHRCLDEGCGCRWFAIPPREDIPKMDLDQSESLLTCTTHKPVQHRDGKPPWCGSCGLTNEFEKPVSRFKPVEIREKTTPLYISPTNEWMQSFSGVAVFPMDIQPEQINIKDISHSLSMQCRYNGHTREFYSVAEHCVHMSYVVPEEDALWALLHDATEAYIGDLIRPVKKHLHKFIEIEDVIMRVIVDKFGLGSYEMPESVKEADNRIIENERRALLTKSPLPWTVHGKPIEGLEIEAWSPKQAEHAYLRRFVELMEKK